MTCILCVMNFLAHLHLASLADSSLFGNLLADFIRGNPAGIYPEPVTAGILMHRRVDTLTDSLPPVRAAKSRFSEASRRVAPITLDVVWDHFLARHWSRIEPTISLPAFSARAQRQIVPWLPDTPPRFQNLNHYLWRERWLERYAELPFIAEVLSSMASRRPRLSALAGSFSDVEENYDYLEQVFWQFYPELMARAQQGELSPAAG